MTMSMDLLKLTRSRDQLPMVANSITKLRLMSLIKMANSPQMSSTKVKFNSLCRKSTPSSLVSAEKVMSVLMLISDNTLFLENP